MSFLSQQSVKIPLKTKIGIEFFVISEIIYFFIENSTVKAHLVDGSSIRVFHTLSELETSLVMLHFYRCHSASLINLYHIKRYSHKTCIVELTNSLSLNVAYYKKVKFNRLINSMLPPPNSDNKQNQRGNTEQLE